MSKTAPTDAKPVDTKATIGRPRIEDGLTKDQRHAPKRGRVLIPGFRATTAETDLAEEIAAMIEYLAEKDGSKKTGILQSIRDRAIKLGYPRNFKGR